MNATGSAPQDATVATPAVRLRFDVIDARCAELEASTDVARAELLGVDRTTLWRWRNDRMGVALGTALDLAERLSLPVESITKREAA